MRTKSLKQNKINVVTLGCSKNVYDSEVLMGQLRANNKEVVHEEEGNVVVINTGPIVIDVPFVMRWALRNAQGHELASGQKAMPANMAPGAQRQGSLTLTFPAVPSLGGYQDVVTFDLVE